MAGWMIIGGSLLVVVTVFERMAGVNDLETRDAIEQFLSQPPGDGLGLDVPAVQSLIRVFSMIAGACAAAAAILGFHVLRRHKGARLALTVLAVPLFLSGLVADGFLSSLVAASAVMLWLEPSRDWFAGRAPRPRPEPERREAGRPEQLPPSAPPGATAPPPTAPPAPAASGPRPHEGFGTSASAPVEPPAQQTAPAPGGPPPATAYPPYGQPYAAPYARPARPAAVVTAAILTWVFAGLTALLLGAAALLMLTSPDLMFDEMHRQDADLAAQGITDRSLQVAIYVLAAVTVVWAALVSAAAVVLVVRRKEWARLAVLFSAGVAAMFCILGLLSGAFLMVVPLLGAVATFALLLRPEVRAWVSAP